MIMVALLKQLACFNAGRIIWAPSLIMLINVLDLRVSYFDGAMQFKSNG
jgi:hypothetical protein